MSADRRFLLLLACALAVVVALGATAHRSLGSPSASASPAWALPSAGRGPDKADRPQLPRSLPAVRVLRPLWTTSLTERFPKLASALSRQRPILADSQIVSYYGNPYTPEMGVLGTADLETVAARLEEHAARYDQLNGPIGVIPAIHLVYAVAQYHPTDNGLYLQYVDDADVRRYLALTEERGMLLFLDLQIGRSSVAAEIQKALPYLRYPQVHLAIDPEFAVASAEVPGTDLGSLRAAEIDEAQAALQKLVDEEGLPPKLLVVHQFADSMVPDGEAIQRYPGVELVVNMDGFGPAAVKRATYQQYASRPYAAYAGIKLFFQQDPDLMSEEDVLLLQPRPAIVIYQ